MGLIEINKNPSPRELKWFGLLFALFFGLVGAIVLWRSGSRTAAVILWSIGSVAAILFYVIRPWQRFMYLGWMYAAFPIGWIVTHVILALIYYLVFTPIGLAMRLLGKDPMNRNLEPETKSYWIEHRSDEDPARYFRQF